MSGNVGFLLFSGANFRAIITLCRFAKAHQIPFYIFAIDAEDAIFATEYWQQVVYTRKTKKLTVAELKPEITQLCEVENLSKIILCPTSEFLNTFFLNRRKSLENEQITVALGTQSVYEIVTNKSSFTQYCHQQKAVVPAYFDDYKKCQLPFVAKPKENVIDGKTLYPHLIFTKEDKTAFDKNEKATNYFFQEYIKGQSYYLFYYINQQAEVCRFSQKNLAQQPNGKSIIFAETSNIHKETVGETYERILQSLGFKGIVMIEIIEKNGQYYLIEANPRFWGPFKLVTTAKPAFTHAFFKDYAELRAIPATEKKSKYLWFGGFLQAMRSPKNIKWYINKPRSLWLFLLKQLTYDVYFHKDTIRYFLKEWR
mgnify:CR=1 FL=1